MTPSENVPLRPKFALFDLDFCLFAATVRMRAYKGPISHLTIAQVDGLSFKHYLINAAVMANIFTELQNKKIITPGFL